MKIQLPPWTRVYGTLVRYAPFVAVLALAVFLPHRVASLPVLGLAFAGAIIDSTLQFCNATALSTAATGLALVGNVIDLTVARNVGNGRPLFLVITVTTAPTSAGAAPVQFILASGAVAAVPVDGSATQHYASAAIPKATLVVGYQLIVPLPLELPAYQEFLAIQQNVGTAALTAGAITAELVLDPPQSKTYPQSARITL
jgi:hypothetical protein